MISSPIVSATWFFVGVLAKAPNIFNPGSTTTSGGTGESFYSSSWTDGQAKAKYTNGAGGEYAVTWSGDKGNFVCGKGWNPGGAR